MGWIYCRRKWDPPKAKMIMMGFTHPAGENFMQFTAKVLLVLLFLFRVVYIIPFSTWAPLVGSCAYPSFIVEMAPLEVNCFALEI
jgi:hypothetical protein